MQLNFKSLKERLSKMANSCNKTANDFQSEAKNSTQRIQQRPMAVPQNQSELKRNRAKRKMSCARFCHKLTKRTKWLAKNLAEPKCATDGNFEKMQCGPSGKKCWCVDEDGERTGLKRNRDGLRCPNTNSGGEQSPPKIKQAQASPPIPAGKFYQ